MTRPIGHGAGLPLFSVIIPTYGRQQYLAQAIRSVLAQRVQDFECIVVDDASPEPVVIPVADPRIRLILRHQNGGPAAARNTGLEHALGRYIAFLDDDDLYTPERLSIAQQGLRQAPIAVCWSRYLPWPGPPRPPRRFLQGNVHDVILDGIAPHVGATTVDREVLVPFDERFEACQDLEWWLRLSEHHRVATVAEDGYLIRRHGGPRNRNGTDARAAATQLLLRVHADYFRTHPRSAAFRWLRVGLMARSVGDHATARRAFARSFRARPSRSAAWHFARSLRTSALRPEPPAPEVAVERSALNGAGRDA